ncbi:MAG: tetratricopeptide repeat protein [Bacteroidota bacterium]
MKTIFYLLLLLGLPAMCYAQETNKVNDALLLDYYQNQRFAEAADYLKKTYTEPINSTKALGQLAYTSNMAGHLADAEGYYQRIYIIDSTNTSVLYSLGSLNLRRGNNARAELYYKRIITRDSTNFMVFKQLATISHDKNDLTSYIAYLQRANKLNPTEPDVAADLSDVYISMNFTSQAEKVLNAAISVDPENIVLLKSLMKLQYDQKKWPETVSTCLKLINYGDGSGPVLTKLGVAYYNIKNYDCSISTLLSMDEIARNETSYYYTGLGYKAVKDQRMAIFYLQKAITEGISPNIGAYYGEVADSNEKLHRFKKAITAYQKSLEFNESSMIYYSLANVYDTYLQDKKSAVKYYKKYLAGKPPVEKQKGFIDYSKSRIATLSK